MSDTNLAFCKKIGWFNGEKAARFAMVVDHGKVEYSGKEPVRGVSVSGAEAVLAKLSEVRG
jgi:alkyl hydroperoxide reductase 1